LEAPELTEELIDKMVAGTRAQAAGRSIRELERLRDDYLVAIQQVLREYNIGAGATLRSLEERLYEESAAAARERVRAAADAGAPAAGEPLRPLEIAVRPEWGDYNGHMTDSRYLQVFGDATDALPRYAGVDEAYRGSGRAMYTAETRVSHRSWAAARPGGERGESRGGRQAPCGLRLRRYDALCPHRGSTADHKDDPRLRAPLAGSARARGRGQRDAARAAAAGAQGEGNRPRPLCRQHAGRSRRRRAGWCE